MTPDAPPKRAPGWRRAVSLAVDLRALALFRVGLAATVLVDLVDRARALELQTSAGPTPLAVLRAIGAAPWSLHAIGEATWSPAGQLAWQVALCALTALVAVALGVGLWTRAMSVLALVLVASVQDRTALSWFYGDAVLVVSLFWACFLPLGARWSVDSRGAGGPGVARSVAAAAALLQPVIVYVCSVFWKLSSESWRAGETVAQSLAMHIHASALGAWVHENAPGGALSALTWLTLVVEGPVALLLIARDARLRVLAVVALALLQAGLDAMMTVGWFTIVSITATLPALPAALFTRARLSGARGEVALHAPAQSSLSRALCAAALAWVLVTNVLGPFVPLPRVKVAEVLGLTQRWAMFVEGRALPIGYFYVIGPGADGVLVEALTGERAPSGARPALPFASFASFRERQALKALLYPSGAPFTQSLGLWLCDRTRARGTEVSRLDGYFADERSAPPTFLELFSVPCARR